MLLDVIRQPSVGQTNALDVIVQELRRESVTEFRAQTGWVQPSGVALIADAVNSLRERGGTATLLCGLSMGAASIEGLTGALGVFDEVFVAFDPTHRTIHSKMYAALGASHAAVLVGSQNLTRGGLVTNHELGVVVRAPRDDEAVLSILDHMDEMLADTGVTQRLTTELIDRLIESGQVSFAVPGRPGAGATPTDRVFAGSRRRFRSDGVGRETRSRVAPAPDANEVPLDPPAVVQRWFKTASRSDVVRPGPRSSSTYTVTLTKSGFPIDSATWFREHLFTAVEWVAVQGSMTKELADVTFEIGGLTPDTFMATLVVENEPKFAAGQGNRVTSIRWSGEVLRLLRDVVDATGMTITIEKFADDRFRLTFSPAPIGPFVGV